MIHLDWIGLVGQESTNYETSMDTKNIATVNILAGVYKLECFYAKLFMNNFIFISRERCLYDQQP